MKTLTIEFDDFPDDHVEVIISPVAMGDIIDIIGRMAELDLTRESVGGALGIMVPYIVSWTWPEPPDVDGLLARDFGLLISIIDAWIDGVREVPRPLSRTSTAGTPSVDAPAKGSRRPSRGRKPSTST